MALVETSIIRISFIPEKNKYQIKIQYILNEQFYEISESEAKEFRERCFLLVNEK